MTDEEVSWTPPGTRYWRRDFRIPEWLPAPVTRSFATWLLPLLDQGFDDASHDDLGFRMELPASAVVNGWCFARDPKAIGMTRALLRQPARMASFGLAMATFIKHPERVERAISGPSHRRYVETDWPAHQAQVSAANEVLEDAEPVELVELIDRLGHSTGTLMLAVVQALGAAGKIEYALASFHQRHLRDLVGGTHLPLVSGLLDLGGAVPHTVASLDWIEPTMGELGVPVATPSGVAAQRRADAEGACRAALAGTKHAARFEEILAVAQRSIPLRQQLVEDFTVAWPTLRRAMQRLGDHAAASGIVAEPADIFHLEASEILASVHGDSTPRHAEVHERKAERELQRSLDVPLELGKPYGAWRKIDQILGVLALPVDAGSEPIVRGVPSSAGVASGRVRIVGGPQDFEAFETDEVLVAAATAPAWTPLFARAAAVVTDSGSPFAHASVVAREYGIPAVVGTGNATVRLKTGQLVRVDGERGVVEAG